MGSNKIGILSLPFEPNYGWIMQLWALDKVLRLEGYNVMVLDRRWNDKSPSLKKNIQRWIYYNVFCRPFTTFFNAHFTKTPQLRSSEEMRYTASEIDTLIIGSDQVWRIENTRGADLNFFADFLEGIQGMKRIAYAASFGNDMWAGSQEETDKVSLLLKSFDMVTVREASGVSMCQTLFDVDARHVVDPTMLLDADAYKNQLHLREKPARTLTTYLLDNSDSKQAFVRQVADAEHLSVIELYPKRRSKFSVYKPVIFWLESIMNADKVVVDSFHGMVFSILFNKQFVVLGNEKRGMTRFRSLLESLDISDRLVNGDLSSADALFDKKIDYSIVNTRLFTLRQESFALLLETLRR